MSICLSCPHTSHPILRSNPDDSTLGRTISAPPLRVEPRSSTAVCACVYDVTVCVTVYVCVLWGKSCSCVVYAIFNPVPRKRPCMHTQGRTIRVNIQKIIFRKHKKGIEIITGNSIKRRHKITYVRIVVRKFYNVFSGKYDHNRFWIPHIIIISIDLSINIVKCTVLSAKGVNFMCVLIYSFCISTNVMTVNYIYRMKLRPLEPMSMRRSLTFPLSFCHLQVVWHW